MSGGAMVFNREELLSIFCGDEALLREVLGVFVKNCDETVASMLADTGADAGALLFSVHRLKGSSANVRAEDFSQACAELERALAQAPGENHAGLIKNVARRYAVFRGEVSSLYPEVAPGAAGELVP